MKKLLERPVEYVEMRMFVYHNNLRMNRAIFFKLCKSFYDVMVKFIWPQVYEESAAFYSVWIFTKIVKIETLRTVIIKRYSYEAHNAWKLHMRFSPCSNVPVLQWFSNGAPQEVARCAAYIMKVYFKNEKKPICIEILIRSLKYINIFLILYTKCARKCLCFTVRREPKKCENHCCTVTIVLWCRK
jgi:hypothetical protein